MPRFFASLSAALLLAACDADAPAATDTEEPAPDSPEVLDDPEIAAGLDGHETAGLPLRLISTAERRSFEEGRAVFARVFTPETGLGPLFNNRSCFACHAGPAIGGFGEQIESHATTFSGGSCTDFEDINGGSVVQDSATPLLFQALGISREPPIPGATAVGLRTTPDLFGFGLIEAIPDEAILRRADPDDRNRDGISGRANRTDEGGLGRFGRKARAGDLEDFIIDAFIYEQGVTSVDEEEQLIAGAPVPAGVDLVADPEITDEELAATITFVRLLAPPRAGREARSDDRGRRLFRDIGCASCHTPAFVTGNVESRALSQRVVRLYSDLLLHDMGPALADICKGDATPSEFRTEPLMGVRFSSVFLHDGRAGTVQQAIELHDGEGKRSRDRFVRLRSREKAALLGFVNGL